MTNINLKKKDIVSDLSKKIGFSSNYSKKIIDDLIDIILVNIKTGNFNLKDIGTFKTISKKERLGRNPKTKKEYIISNYLSFSVISFRTLQDLYNLVSFKISSNLRKNGQNVIPIFHTKYYKGAFRDSIYLFS